MSETTPHDALIRDLAAGLRPVRRLAPPWLRALGWLAVLGALAAVLAGFTDLGAMVRRLGAAPDMWLAATGSAATAVLASIAAFQTSVPGRGWAWPLLPVPALLLWIGASGLGCLREWIIPGTRLGGPDHGADCLVFIVCVSVPLSVMLLLMLRRACPLRPGRTAALGGLAAAAGAAMLLNFFHPYDAAATDLLVHAVAVALVVLANRALGERLLGG